MVRHSREGGNPLPKLDPRLRGDDEIGSYFRLILSVAHSGWQSDGSWTDS